jgi:hypothetical protein
MVTNGSSSTAYVYWKRAGIYAPRLRAGEIVTLCFTGAAPSQPKSGPIQLRTSGTGATNATVYVHDGEEERIPSAQDGQPIFSALTIANPKADSTKVTLVSRATQRDRRAVCSYELRNDGMPAVIELAALPLSMLDGGIARMDRGGSLTGENSGARAIQGTIPVIVRDGNGNVLAIGNFAACLTSPEPTSG